MTRIMMNSQASTSFLIIDTARAKFKRAITVTEKRKSGLFPMYFDMTTRPNTMKANWMELMMMGVLCPSSGLSELMKSPP